MILTYRARIVLTTFPAGSKIDPHESDARGASACDRLRPPARSQPVGNAQPSSRKGVRR